MAAAFAARSMAAVAFSRYLTASSATAAAAAFLVYAAFARKAFALASSEGFSAASCSALRDASSIVRVASNFLRTSLISSSVSAEFADAAASHAV